MALWIKTIRFSVFRFGGRGLGGGHMLHISKVGAQSVAFTCLFLLLMMSMELKKNNRGTSIFIPVLDYI